jgi:tRNA (guanine37-N1)-methyltransferase
MQFVIITIFPEMFTALIDFGVIGRAVKTEKIILEFINPRDFAEGHYRRVDERPYGGGPGMVMMAEPLYQAIHAAKEHLGHDAQVIYLSPQGKTFKQQDAQTFLNMEKLILLCGRYEGVDQRLLDQHIDLELSVGDFVVSGGELPAMLVVDAVARLVPGVLHDENSKVFETHQGEFVDYPHYTTPRVWQGISVPEILLSGDHQGIAAWRQAEAERRTRK